MRYGIVGSRRRTDKEKVVAFVSGLSREDVIISGGCRGVDTWAVEAGRNFRLRVVEHLPDLSGCKEHYEFTRAYYARNERIAMDCDVLVAFVSPDRTGGTENTISYARKYGKPVIIL